MTMDIFALVMIPSFFLIHDISQDFLHFNNSKTTGATYGAGNAYIPEHLSSSMGFSAVRVAQCFLYYGLLTIIIGLFVLFLVAIVLSVLRFSAFDYLFGIFKLFLCLTSSFK
jgi:hypothetical protein